MSLVLTLALTGRRALARVDGEDPSPVLFREGQQMAHDLRRQRRQNEAHSEFDIKACLLTFG